MATCLLSSLRMIPLSCSQLGHHFPYLEKKEKEESKRRTGADVLCVKEKKRLENGARKWRDSETDNLVELR